jgi:hypothetical protein
MTEPIFEGLEHAWDAFTRGAEHAGAEISQHLPHAHYHDPGRPSNPATEAPMSILTSIENEIHTLAAQAKKIEEEVLPAAAADAQKAEALLSSPLADALLGALHVPADAILSAVAPVLNFLAGAYPKPADTQQVVDPAPVQEPVAVA